MNNNPCILSIERIYDPLTGSRNGVITPCAPVMVSFSGPLTQEDEEARFYLSPEGSEQLIAVAEVCIYKKDKVIVMLPHLSPGRYRPVMMIIRGKRVSLVTARLDVVWTVEEEGLY